MSIFTAIPEAASAQITKLDGPDLSQSCWPRAARNAIHGKSSNLKKPSRRETRLFVSVVRFETLWFGLYPIHEGSKDSLKSGWAANDYGVRPIRTSKLIPD